MFNQLDSFENVKDIVTLRLKNEHSFSSEEYTSDYIGDIRIGYAIPVDSLDEEMKNAINVKVNEHSKDVIGAAIRILKPMVDKWGIGEKELYDAALKNTIRQNKAEYATLEDMVMSMMFSHSLNFVTRSSILDLKTEPNKQVVVTNKDKYYGAVIMLDHFAMDEISEYFNGNFYIIPSSTNEIIVVGVDVLHADSIVSMVKEINTTIVDEKDLLSNHLYEYDSVAEKVVVVA